MTSAAKRQPIPSRVVLRNPICLLAFGFGSGLAPKAPGTFGTLAAIPFYWLAAPLPVPAYLLLALGMLIAGIWICGRCEQIIGVDDHSGIVFDEFVGLFVTFIAAPATPAVVFAGFCLFRLFDILKPWPIAWFDRRVHGGLGIMLDDVLAGMYAALCLTGLRGYLE
jgi:phosphatidylglycerophosphatase A